MRLAVVGVSYRTAPVELRERLSLATIGLGRSLADVTPGVEFAVLTTCGRTEVYLAGGDVPGATQRTLDLFADHGVGAPQALVNEDAIVHLFRVAAGLESLVPGESQILGQIRGALKRAQRNGGEPALVHRLFSHALRTGKRARSETGFIGRPASAAETAVRLACRAFADPGALRVVVVGAGRTSALAATSFACAGAGEICVVNRTSAHAEALARRLGCRATGLAQLAEEVARADVVVSATSCPSLVLGFEDVASAVRRRRHRRLLLIDLAVPRDLDPRIRELGCCDLYDIDELGELSRRARASTAASMARASLIVDEETERFLAWLRSLEVVPEICSLRKRGEQIRRAQLARAEPSLRTLSPAQRRIVERLTTQIVNKLLHAPTVRVKEIAASGDGSRQRALLRDLFALGEEAA